MTKIKNAFTALGFSFALFVCATTSYAQGNSKDVNVVNMPNVKVVNTPDVRDADNPARQPVQVNGFCAADRVLDCSVNIYTVPQGKRLVIEYVSMDAALTTDQVAQLTMQTIVGGEDVIHRFPLTPLAVLFQGFSEIAALGQQVRLYADAGTSVNMTARRNNVGPAFIAIFRFSISGYLVDVP